MAYSTASKSSDSAVQRCPWPDSTAWRSDREPDAVVWARALRERGRYRAVQIAAVKTWAPVEADGEAWFGFAAVRAIPGTRDEVLPIPLPGHTCGHCGVAVRMSEG